MAVEHLGESLGHHAFLRAGRNVDGEQPEAVDEFQDAVIGG
ncbi:MAG: hypothetical protein P8X94_07175 [Woeseiaceae bacterium]